MRADVHPTPADTTPSFAFSHVLVEYTRVDAPKQHPENKAMPVTSYKHTAAPKHRASQHARGCRHRPEHSAAKAPEARTPVHHAYHAPSTQALPSPLLQVLPQMYLPCLTVEMHASSTTPRHPPRESSTGATSAAPPATLLPQAASDTARPRSPAAHTSRTNPNKAMLLPLDLLGADLPAGPVVAAAGPDPCLAALGLNLGHVGAPVAAPNLDSDAVVDRGRVHVTCSATARRRKESDLRWKSACINNACAADAVRSDATRPPASRPTANLSTAAAPVAQNGSQHSTALTLVRQVGAAVANQIPLLSAALPASTLLSFSPTASHLLPCAPPPWRGSPGRASCAAPAGPGCTAAANARP